MSDESTYEGVCGEVIEISAHEDKVAVTLDVRALDHIQAGPDEHGIVLGAALFKHLFKSHFSPHSLGPSDFHVVVEVPKVLLREEWKAAFEATGFAGAAFRVTTAPVKNDLSRFIPQVVTYDDQNCEEE